ncbi:MAG: HTTM domain-containing protein [Planctomycetota bacterium]
MPTTRSSSPSPRLGSLFAPVDGASLAFFRVCFGGLIVVEVVRFFVLGRIGAYYVEPVAHFKYLGFGWVRPWPGVAMYVHFVAVGVLGAAVMLGWRYRVTSVLLALGFAYWFLLDKAQYLNHLYLTTLLGFLLACLPAERVASLDAKRRALPSVVPRWSIWLLRAQFALVYVFAGLAKVGGDWAEGNPMRDWLADREGLPVLGPWLVRDLAVPFFVYGGMLFDLFVVPLLLWRPTRVVGVALSLGFHGLNFLIFSIGIFPFMMLAATTLFFEPDWPRGFGLVRGPARTAPGPQPTPLVRRSILALLALYLALQLLVPLRHFAYRGNVHWTEEGHCFAWHMLLRSKRASPPRFLVTDPATGETWREPIERWLTERQYRKVGQWPDMAHQCALIIAAREREQNGREVEVRVQQRVSLNGRRFALLVDPTVDLAKRARSLAAADWILPLADP